MNARLTVYADHTRNKISRFLFGHFMEHCADLIYGSVYDPQHALADEDGFRTDILEALKEVKVPMLRYPGGNFVSNYHWENGIGPVENRPKVFDYAWLAEDDNRFGTVEFIKLCRKVDAEPYICVNMGSGTAEEAMNWVEFCNGTGDTKYVRLRKSLGYEEPFQVKYWGLGNELYGDWQFGKCNAEDYAKKALDFAKAMKWRDPSVELVACGYDIGSEWNYITAKKLKPLIKHIAIHHYSIGYGVFNEENYEECMYLTEYIKKLTDVCHADILAGTDDALTDIKVAWDEWNTHAWDFDKEDSDSHYTLKNAILTACILHSFLHSSNVVEIAGYSPFVNGVGALSVKENMVVKRVQYHVFKALAEAFEKCDEYMESRTESEMYELDEVIDYSNRPAESKFALNAKFDKRRVKTQYVDCVAAMNADQTKMVISILNKHPEKDCEVSLTVFGKEICWETMKCSVLYHEDFGAANTEKEPEKVILKKEKLLMDNKNILTKKHSLTIVEVDVE